jgi:hypothetical protein
MLASVNENAEVEVVGEVKQSKMLHTPAMHKCICFFKIGGKEALTSATTRMTTLWSNTMPYWLDKPSESSLPLSRIAMPTEICRMLALEQSALATTLWVPTTFVIIHARQKRSC